MTKNIYINILLVFLCLYTFLIGIKGLSKAIEGISSPDEIFAGDQVQLKKISIIESNQEITLKKQWVEVTTEPDEDGNFSYILSFNSSLYWNFCNSYISKLINNYLSYCCYGWWWNY